MRERKFFALSLMVLFFSFLLVPAQAQFNWPNGGWPNNDRNYGISRFVWEGVVDGTTYVRVQRNRAFSENVNGLPVQRQRYNFSDPLPRASVNLDLVVLNGRGRVRLVETPQQRNDYTAVVRIDDNSGGSDAYRFELRWNDRTRNDNHRDPVAQGGVVWSGQVDGEVMVRFRGNNAWVENRNGQGAWNDRYQFTRALPPGVQTVNLYNVRGRGEIVIIEQPGSRNNYTASVLIRDRQNGASNYSFALSWDRARNRNDRYDDGDWRNWDDSHDRNDDNNRRPRQ